MNEAVIFLKHLVHSAPIQRVLSARLSNAIAWFKYQAKNGPEDK
jgi:hypothetical protein